MRDILALRARTLEFLDGLLHWPTMHAPGGMSVEAFLLHTLSQLMYIDDTEAALDRELSRLRDSGLWAPRNHGCGVTAAFESALPDCADRLSIEVAAVYAEVAHRLGLLPREVGEPSAAAWRQAYEAWSAGPFTARRARELLGDAPLALGSATHDLALCYGTAEGSWTALHFKVPPYPSDPALRSSWTQGVGDGSTLLLRWARLSSRTLDESLVLTAEGYALSRRGLAHPLFRLDRWLAGDPDPFDRLPEPAGEA